MVTFLSADSVLPASVEIGGRTYALDASSWPSYRDASEEDLRKAWLKTVGDAALRHTEKQPGRLKLVGFKMENDSAAAPKDGSPIVDKRIRGYVCTARLSVALKEAIGLALVDDELAAVGSRLAIYEDSCQGQLIYAKVVQKPFYDPQGKHLRM